MNWKVEKKRVWKESNFEWNQNKEKVISFEIIIAKKKLLKIKYFIGG